MIRSTAISTLVFVLFLFSLDIQAQSPETSVLVQSEPKSNAEEAPALDLFDEDAELTEKGWAQFYDIDFAGPMAFARFSF